MSVLAIGIVAVAIAMGEFDDTTGSPERHRDTDHAFRADRSTDRHPDRRFADGHSPVGTPVQPTAAPTATPPAKTPAKPRGAADGGTPAEDAAPPPFGIPGLPTIPFPIPSTLPPFPIPLPSGFPPFTLPGVPGAPAPAPTSSQ